MMVKIICMSLLSQNVLFGSNFPPNIPHKMQNNLGKMYRSGLFTYCKSFDWQRAGREFKTVKCIIPGRISEINFHTRDQVCHFVTFSLLFHPPPTQLLVKKTKNNLNRS